MKKICPKCKNEYTPELQKCPECGAKLKAECTEEELWEIQKQNDDFTVINTLIM